MYLHSSLEGTQYSTGTLVYMMHTLFKCIQLSEPIFKPL